MRCVPCKIDLLRLVNFVFVPCYIFVLLDCSFFIVNYVKKKRFLATAQIQTSDHSAKLTSKLKHLKCSRWVYFVTWARYCSFFFLCIVSITIVLLLLLFFFFHHLNFHSFVFSSIWFGLVRLIWWIGVILSFSAMLLMLKCVMNFKL